jgi:hypothetical protein
MVVLSQHCMRSVSRARVLQERECVGDADRNATTSVNTRNYVSRKIGDGRHFPRAACATRFILVITICWTDCCTDARRWNAEKTHELTSSLHARGFDMKKKLLMRAEILLSPDMFACRRACFHYRLQRRFKTSACAGNATLSKHLFSGCCARQLN